MARIRAIKPEFYSSPNPPSRDARLLFIAMWNWADDAGVGTANPGELRGFAFPHDDDVTSADIRGMLGEIRRAYGVIFYNVGGRPYYSIPSWDKHQKIDRRSQGKHPTPDEADEYLYLPDQQEHENSSEPRRSPSSPRRTPGAGTGEQGNRGTGEKNSSVALVGGSGGKPPTSARGTRLPANWKPADDVVAQMRSDHPHIDLRAEHAKFVDYWHAKAGQNARKVDWTATWRNWIRRAAEQHHPNGHGPPPRTPTVKAQSHLDVAAELIAERQRQRETDQPGALEA